MRKLVTGLDAAGRSCLVEEGELPFDAVPGFGVAPVYATPGSPPPPRPVGRGHFLDLGVPPGIVSWQVVDHEPGAVSEMHHTDTIDFDLVLEGAIDLVLDDGPHRLQAGDCVIVTGVDHCWKAGAARCRVSITSLGTPPPD